MHTFFIACLSAWIPFHRFVDNGDMAESFPYRTKALFAFEDVDGVDVCFFGMHVQEYGSDCPPPNQRSGKFIYLFIFLMGLFLFPVSCFLLYFFFFSSIIQTSLHILPGQCPLLSATLSENRRVPWDSFRVSGVCQKTRVRYSPILLFQQYFYFNWCSHFCLVKFLIKPFWILYFVGLPQDTSGLALLVKEMITSFTVTLQTRRYPSPSGCRSGIKKCWIKP